MIFSLLFTAAVLHAQTAKRNDMLSKQLDSMLAADQQWRTEFVKQLRGEKTDYDSATINMNLKETDSLNKIAVRRILKQYGYPGFNLAGEKACEAFGILVLHCDDDVALQEQALQLLAPEIKKNNAPKKIYAFLTDRVLINKGQQQRYGTQTEMSADGTQFVAAPVADMKNVDKRRKKLGLPPLKAYLKQVNDQLLKQQ